MLEPHPEHQEEWGPVHKERGSKDSAAMNGGKRADRPGGRWVYEGGEQMEGFCFLSETRS